MIITSTQPAIETNTVQKQKLEQKEAQDRIIERSLEEDRKKREAELKPENHLPTLTHETIGKNVDVTV